MFNPAIYANSPAGGHGVLQVIGDGTATPADQRFVPLHSTTLTGTIAGPLADLRLIQTFAFTRVEFDGVVEAAYRFPLPGDAAVRGVSVRFGDVDIRAELQARAEATRAYEEAKQEGRQAALITREAPDVFTLQVAGIQPDQAVEVSTSYVQLAHTDGLAWLLRIPLTTAPRYVREDDLGTAHGRGQPLRVLRDPGHRFRLDVTLLSTGSVTSPTHALDLTKNDGITRARLVAGEIVPDRDCVLVWTPSQVAQHPVLHVFTQDDEHHTYFLALVAPPAIVGPEELLPREIIVLLDHSGSMHGPKWQAADWAVAHLLHDLSAADRFDLCLFHTTTAWFAPAPLRAAADTVETAADWLRQQRDSGGTNLGVALEEALLLPRGDGETAPATPVRNVLIVTDAAVSDGGRILRLADQEAMQADRRRLNVLCIDAAPNAFLANELAARGGGIAAFLTSRPEAEDITTALEGILTTWAKPVHRDLRVSVQADAVEAAQSPGFPAHTPGWQTVDLGDLPAGQARWVAGRVPRTGDRPLRVRLEDANGVLGDASVYDEGPTLEALKALFGVRRVNALEFLSTARYADADLDAQLQRLGYDPTEILDGQPQRVYAETTATQTSEALQGLLLDESLRYGLLSSATGFVAVRREAGQPVDARVVVASALPDGWSGAFLAPGGGVVRVADHRANVQGFTPALSANFPPFTGAMAPRPDMARGGPGAGLRATWHTVFDGRLPAGSASILHDATASNPHRELISGLRLIPSGTVPAAAGLADVMLLLFVGDMALPRARIRLVDLLRTPERPLNLARRPHAGLRLVLTDPERRLDGQPLAVTIDLQTAKM